MVVLKLRNPKEKADTINIVIDCFSSYTSKNWQKCLLKNIKEKVDIKTHVSFHGWLENQNRTLKDICDDMNNSINEINAFDFSPLPDRKIGPLLSHENFNMEVANILHDQFVFFEGGKTADNLEKVSPYFKIATPEIRWHISKINHIAHETTHYAHALYEEELYGAYGYSPEIHVHFYKTDLIPYDERDYESFDDWYRFGRVYVGDPSVGKTYWDAFNDLDTHILNKQLVPPTFNVADFHIHFGEDAEQEWIDDTRRRYKDFLTTRGLQDLDEANVMLGKPVVGQVNFDKSFNTNNRTEIIKLVSCYCEIDSIQISEDVIQYDYNMFNEGIDIKHHA